MKKGLNLFNLALVTAGTAILTKRALAKRARFDFEDKVVLITGASRGLGLVLARQLAREGARVAICARDDDELQRAQDELRRLGSETLAVKCDVTVKSEVEEMVRIVKSQLGPIDVLVNNAGVIQVGPLEVMTAEDFDEAMKTHFWGPLNTVLAILPGMRERGQGRIVNISSIGGKISIPHLVPYSASKFALVGLSQGLRAELLKEGILVTTVCPGLMRTGSPRNAEFKGRHRAEYAWFSISDALPVTSINAGRAASQILEACRRGQAELVISVQAKLAVIFHGLFPGMTADLLGTVNKLLPAARGIGRRKAKGKDSTSSWSPSWITFLNERAAVMNNEIRR
jgi:NAD(P)-dependent dehydrogenase (short-subunit alcohol dehydrogenase family)